MNSTKNYIRLGEYFLLEFTGKEKELNTSNNQIISYAGKDGSIYILNEPDSLDNTRNTEHNLVFDMPVTDVISDINEGRSFSRLNPDEFVKTTNTLSGLLSYDQIKLHIRTGYNFQDSEGFRLSLFLESALGHRVNLLSQSFLKGNINEYGYNEFPLSISEQTYDKFIEFNTISISKLLLETSSERTIVNSISSYNSNPFLFMEFRVIESVVDLGGYRGIDYSNTIENFIPAGDPFENLTADILEKESYFQYKASFEGSSVEDFIFSLNSNPSNNYALEHEINVFEQRGTIFEHVERVIQLQYTNFDRVYKYRPVLSNFVDGSMQVEYTLRLVNRNDGLSVVKTASINSTNTQLYLETPFRISVEGVTQFSVYNKVFKNEINVGSSVKQFDNQVLIPMYLDKKTIVMKSEPFALDVSPFTNIYEINLLEEINGQEIPYFPENLVSHEMVFVINGVEEISIVENKDQENNGLLYFKITEDKAKVITSKNKGIVYINSVKNGVRTNLTSGEWAKEGYEVKIPVILDLVKQIKTMEEVILPIEPITASFTQESADVILPTNATIETNIQEIQNNQITATVIENKIIKENNEKIIKVVNDGNNLFLERIKKQLLRNNMKFIEDVS